MDGPNLVALRSAFTVRETIDRLAAIVVAKGLTVFLRIDHAANAAGIGAALRPTELLVFGSPAGGTALMLDQQSAGLDVPVRVLAWEDAQGRSWLGYEPPARIAQRHALGERSSGGLQAIADGLAAVCAAAASGDA